MNKLIVRSLSGLLFLAIMVCSLIFNEYVFFALTCVIALIGAYEFFKMLIPKGHEISKLIGMITIVSVISITFYGMQIDSLKAPTILIIVLLIFTTMIFIAELYQNSKRPFDRIGAIILSVLYIATPLALMHALAILTGNANNEYNGIVILSIFILVWANDVGAYCFGMLLGQRGKNRLFPRISPKKTWEGFFGGLLMSIVAAILVSKFILNEEILETPHWIIISIIVSVFGTFGDLAESMLKRSVNVKDSGKIMPGHGGILDRFDAVFISFPMVFVYMIIFL